MKDELKKLERLSGLSGRKLADKAGISPTTYQNYKNRDVRWLPLYNAEKLADALAEYNVPRQDVLALSGYPLGRPLTETEMEAIKLLARAEPDMQAKVIRAIRTLVPDDKPDTARERQAS